MIICGKNILFYRGENMLPAFIKDHIKMGIAEDIGIGDITTELVANKKLSTKAFIKAKEEGIIAGIILLEEVFKQIDNTLEIKLHTVDGNYIIAGQVVAEIHGDANSILKGERIALNYLQYLSGIATKTHKIITLVKSYPVRVVDTRKTLPGMRWLAKYAVRMGGGHNHRFNLSDGILIKDNHIKAAGGITEAIFKAKKGAPHTLKIEIEVESIDTMLEAINAGADIVMLDNMSPEAVKEAVKLAQGKVLIEVSGGITEKNILDYAKSGVNVISLGALTHSVKALDLSLDLMNLK